MMHVMIDLETMGTQSNAAIMSIGAVKFNPFDADSTLSCFHQTVDLKSCLDHGLKITAKTLLWWMDPERDKPRAKWMSSEKVDLVSTLEGFVSWYGNESMPTWGNGATFDNVILRRAMDQCAFEVPWKYYHDRCFRTFKNLAPGVEAPAPDVPHDALSDAIAQVKHMQAIIKHLGLETVE